MILSTGQTTINITMAVIILIYQLGRFRDVQSIFYEVIHKYCQLNESMFSITTQE